MPSDTQFNDLHILLVSYLTDRLREARIKNDDGKIITPMAAAELSVLRQFLKDNGIVVDKNHAEDLQRLQDALKAEDSAAARKDIIQEAIANIADNSRMLQ